MRAKGLAEHVSRRLAQRLFDSLRARRPGASPKATPREFSIDQFIEAGYARAAKVIADEGYTVEPAWLRHIVGRLYTGYTVLPW